MFVFSWIIWLYRANKILRQLNREIQQLHLTLRNLGIGTYVHATPGSDTPDGHNPYSPIATATLTTPVFDVVHMFSERSISAVPIIDEDGVVVNLYETVDVIVCPSSSLIGNFFKSQNVDTRPLGGLPIPRLDNIGSTQPALTRFPRCGRLYRLRLTRDASAAHQEATCA